MEKSITLEKLKDAFTFIKAYIDKNAGSSKIMSAALSASAWDSETKTYSFESVYPNESYDIEIEPDSTCTEAQLEAWSGARLTGSSTGNVAKAFGDIPTIDIPIIVRVVKK